MAVYVDDAVWPLGRMKMCHMIADTPEELHAVARAIGLKRQWYQNKTARPHYDVSKGKRLIAVERLGAIPCDRRTFVGHMRRIMKEVAKNPEPWELNL